MDKLTEIINWKREEVAKRVRPVHEPELQRLEKTLRPLPRFLDVLEAAPGLGLISEIKRKSPSAGMIAEGMAATEQARLYYNAGTDAISVLTDEKYFGGSIRDLWDVNDLLANRPDTPPTLRKDFFVDPIQIVEAAEAGARCILIIVRALGIDEMKRLYEFATMAGLDSIFEVHSMEEVETALPLKPQIIGVNNRDLSRFKTDLGISESIIPQLPEDVLAISESGIWSVEDAQRVHQAGAKAILVGEALMKMNDPEPFIQAIHEL